MTDRSRRAGRTSRRRRRPARQIALALLRAQKPPDLVVGREHCRGRAELGAHVSDHVAIHRRQTREPGSVVLDDLAEPASHTVPAQHLEDHVLGAHPLGQRAFEPNAEDLRHAQMERLAGHRERHLEPARPDREHAERARCARVAVGTQQRLARLTEPLHVQRMADAVARPGCTTRQTSDTRTSGIDDRRHS